MIFPNSQNVNVNQIPQLFNTSGISLPIAYNGTQINYRDSSWLKLNVCELFLANMCPNVDNCSLAHPPNTVKFENNKVTVCYDYIKKRDCKHSNCKYYHPHEALSSAILRRGDETKKNGNSLSDLGLTFGVQSPFQLPRSQNIFNLQTQNFLSNQMNNSILADSQMKAKLEVIRQFNSVNAPQTWLPGLNAASTPTLVNPSNSLNISLQSLLPSASVKNSIFNPYSSLVSMSNCPLRSTMVDIADQDTKLIGVKRAASDIFGSVSDNSHIYSTSNNIIYGLPDIKKEKIADTVPETVTNSNTAVVTTSPYYMPASIALFPDQLQTSSPIHVPVVAGANVPSNFTIMQNSPLQTSPLSGYHQLGSFNVNNLILQSLLSNNHQVINPNIETQLAFSGQKLYTPMNTYPQVNAAQLSLINQLCYQQMLQNSLSGPQQIFYPGTVNIADQPQRGFEDTSVAFINEKGTILETLPVCKDFLQGKCKRNQLCNYVHLLDANVEIKDSKLTVCKNALKGQCHRPVCKFYHIPTYQLQRLGIQIQI